MQCNPQYFVTGPPNCSQFYPCSQPYQPPYNVPCPDIIGEGEITSIVLPDGSVQLYFLPTIKWSPNVQNANLINCSPYWNPSTGAWFIRSVSNQIPSPTPFFPQQCAYPRSNSQFTLPPCHSIPVKFHNDNWSSTTDLHYFSPCLRTCEVTPQPCAAGQTTVPTVSCCYGTVCDNPCYCSPNSKGAPSISKGHDCNVCTKERAKLSRCESDMSVDETRQKSPKKQKGLVICECNSSTSATSLDSKKREKKAKQKRSTSNSTASSSSSICKRKSEINKAKKCQEKAHRKAEAKERKRREKEEKKREKEILKLEKARDKKYSETQISTTESDYNSCDCFSSSSFKSIPTSSNTSISSCNCDKSYKQKAKLEKEKRLQKNKQAKNQQDNKLQLQEKRTKQKQEKEQKKREKKKKKTKNQKLQLKEERQQKNIKLENKKSKQDKETTDKRSRELGSCCECPETPEIMHYCNLEGCPIHSSYDHKIDFPSCCGDPMSDFSTRDMYCECPAPLTSNKLLATQNDQASSGICLNPRRGLDFCFEFPTNTNCCIENNSVELCAQTLSNEPLTVRRSLTQE